MKQKLIILINIIIDIIIICIIKFNLIHKYVLVNTLIFCMIIVVLAINIYHIKEHKKICIILIIILSFLTLRMIYKVFWRKYPLNPFGHEIIETYKISDKEQFSVIRYKSFIRDSTIVWYEKNVFLNFTCSNEILDTFYNLDTDFEKLKEIINKKDYGYCKKDFETISREDLDNMS